MTDTLSLPVLGGPVSVEAPTLARPLRPVEMLRIPTADLTSAGGHAYAFEVPKSFHQALFGSDAPVSGDMPVGLLEDNQMLGPGEQVHALIRRQGTGAFSAWANANPASVTLFFSTSDNSDPRTNGRVYTLINQQLGFANDWNVFSLRRWHNHSRARYYLRRGGATTPPPLYASMGITDICNLQCGICGSQNMLTPVNRRHMDYRIFSMVADTLFPMIVCVEFNSRGEPMIHPQFSEMLETVLDHELFLRLQTNGTQFTGRKLQLVGQMSGDISISIDATGDLFEYARTGGKWAQVDQGCRGVMKLRDPEKVGVGLYPTLTGKTIEGAPALIDWAMELGVDRIDFHVYEPIACGAEAAPTQAQLDALKQHVRRLDSKHPIRINVEFEMIKDGELPPVARPQQMRWANIPRPVTNDDGHPAYTCMAPVQQVEVDLDGSVCVCCRLQERKLGNALTPEAFADCWFGAEYQRIRDSLRRGSASTHYETCSGCVKHYAGDGIGTTFDD